MKNKYIQLAAAIAVLGAVCVGAAAAPTQPNFLFVILDDQRYDAMGVVQREQGDTRRFPWFQTPNMDRIAAEGIRFRNAFVTESLCSPSRAVMLTGRYNHFNGIADNFTPFPTNSVTYASQLRAAGYTTAYIGKWHMGRQSGQRPGFDYSASFLGHGQYWNCPFEIDGVKELTTGWVDDVSTDFAIDFMKKNQNKPFLLTVGFKSPHAVPLPPERLKDAFAGDHCRPAVNAHVIPPWRGEIKRPKESNPAIPDAHLDYFRCIAGADENLGRLLDTLDELGLATNTLVIFTSDNGFYLGDHNSSDKRSAYEESMRVPLLMRYPKLGVKGITVDEMTLNIDLPETILDFAGVSIPAGMQGTSLRPLLERKSVAAMPDWRDSFFYEYFWERLYDVPTMTAIRTGSAKLILYPGHPDWTEMFDLKADSYETNNLARNPAGAKLRADLQTEYGRQSKLAGYLVPKYADDPTKPYVKKPKSAKMPPGNAEEGQ